MSNALPDVFADVDLTPAMAPEGRDSGSWRRVIWTDEGDKGTIVAVWKAEPGVYPYPARQIEETFVVLEGEARCRVGDGEATTIGLGSIVRVPYNTPIHLEVTKPFRKVATVVPKA